MALHIKEETQSNVDQEWVLRRTFGLKRAEVTEWRQLHNEESDELYRSPNTMRAMK